jgi:peptidoglycan/LPS O-acetylase OafA/YrhL
VTQISPTKPRLAYLDITKGILVLLMVVYHTLNYTNQYQLAFRYLSFLPLSFILITGFLLSTVYFSRYNSGDRGLVRRLLVRGARLFAIFTILNIAAQFVRSPAYGESVGVVAFYENWFEVYLLGGGRIAVFEVLLPIAYLLLLAPGLIALAHHHAWFLAVTSVLLIAGCSFLDRSGVALINLNFLSVGVLGMLAGRLLPDPSCLGRFIWLALLAYIAYFPLGVDKGWVFLIQLLGALVALTLICAASVRLNESGWWRRRLLRLGQYSLVSYIVQIAILQVLSRLIGRPDPFSIEALFVFTVTLVLMTVIVEATEWLRDRSSGIDTIYKTIFA